MAFVERFGPYAGWAHNTLFIAELASQQVHAMLRRLGRALSNCRGNSVGVLVLHSS